MFWFKNLMIYKLTSDIDLSHDTLSKAVENDTYTPCSPNDISKFGWATPIKNSKEFVKTIGHYSLLLSHKEEKNLPSNVVKEKTEERIEALEEKEGRKLKKTEKQSIKDDVIISLLPHAFSKHNQTAIIIDRKNKLIYVDSSSAKKSEDTLALLRKSLGSLPVVPFSFSNDLSMLLTGWVSQNTLPEWLEFTGNFELKNEQDSTLSGKNEDMTSEDILNHLINGKYVSKVSVMWENHLDFTICMDSLIKSIKYTDDLTDKNDDILKEDIEQRFDADFVLMTETLDDLISRLKEAFDYQE